MTLWGKFFRIFAPQGEAEDPSPKVRDEQIPGTLDLGWYWSEDKAEYQMAKIAQNHRATHLYVIGATGTGKTKFLEFLIQQDIAEGNGFAVIDPHGDLVEDIKGFLACRYRRLKGEEEISERLILIDPADPARTVTFNPLEKMPNVSVAEQAGELVNAFKKIWSASWGVRMEDLMRNALIALGEAGLTLVELPLFLTNRAVRASILRRVRHPIAREYFRRFDHLTDRGQIGWIEPVMNKMNALLSDRRLRDMFSHPRSSFNLRDAMDRRRMLLVKLDKGKLRDSADLLGSLLLAKIQMTAFSRTDLPPNRRVPFYLYIDEFQNFATPSFLVILSEARKYGLSLIMCHQTLGQIPTELRSMILGNTGIQVYFRLNRQDAALLAREAFEYSGYEVKTVSSLRPVFWSLGEEWERHTAELQSLPPRTCYVKHKIEGGIIPLTTVEIEPPCELLGMAEEEYREWIRSLPFGRNYLVSREKLAALSERRRELIQESIVRGRKRKQKAETVPSRPAVTARKAEKKRAAEEELSADEMTFLEFVSLHPGMFVTATYKALGLSGYKGDKLKKGLIEKGLLTQEETREGRKGRLAKVLGVTVKGASVLRTSPGPGKGGDIHKQIQFMVKEQAELYGWKARVEERIRGSLETVDVGLCKDDVRVAVEISSTTGPEQEIENIRKCLSTGYDYVLSVCPDAQHLSLLKREVRKRLVANERDRVRFFLPSKVKRFLSGAVSPAIVSEKPIVSDQIPRQKELLGTKEAAELLGISRHTLYEWIVRRKIPHLKVGRLVKFRREDLESWLKERTQAADKKMDLT